MFFTKLYSQLDSNKLFSSFQKQLGLDPSFSKTLKTLKTQKQKDHFIYERVPFLIVCVCVWLNLRVQISFGEELSQNGRHTFIHICELSLETRYLASIWSKSETISLLWRGHSHAIKTRNQNLLGTSRISIHCKQIQIDSIEIQFQMGRVDGLWKTWNLKTSHVATEVSTKEMDFEVWAVPVRLAKNQSKDCIWYQFNQVPPWTARSNRIWNNGWNLFEEVDETKVFINCECWLLPFHSSSHFLLKRIEFFFRQKKKKISRKYVWRQYGPLETIPDFQGTFVEAFS